MTGSGLMTLPEAASLLRLTVSTLRSWVLRRKIAYVKVGRLVRLRRVDVEALVEASIVPARTEYEIETKPQPKVNSHANQSPQFFPQS